MLAKTRLLGTLGREKLVVQPFAHIDVEGYYWIDHVGGTAGKFGNAAMVRVVARHRPGRRPAGQASRASHATFCL